VLIMSQKEVEISHFDPMGNPVIKNEVDPNFVGIPTGPEAMPKEYGRKYPIVTGNEMFSKTDYYLAI